MVSIYIRELFMRSEKERKNQVETMLPRALLKINNFYKRSVLQTQ